MCLIMAGVWYTCMSFTMKAWLLLHWGYNGATSWLCYMRLRYGSVMAVLWLGYGCCYCCCVSRRQAVMAAVPARREQTCLQFLQFLKSSSSLLAHGLSTLGSANSENSVNSKTIGNTNRISNTTGIVSRMNSNTTTKDISLKQ